VSRRESPTNLPSQRTSTPPSGGFAPDGETIERDTRLLWLAFTPHRLMSRYAHYARLNAAGNSARSV
jgi:hypothetical protein